MGESASWLSEAATGDASSSGDLSDGLALLRCGPFRAALPTGDPAAGLRDVSFDGVALAATLFSVTTPAGPLAPASETYVRGGDYVSTHPPTEGFPFRTQLYWSAKPVAGGGVAATLSLSLQTDLLDTSPVLTLGVSQATAPTVSGDACRFDLPNATLIIAPHPTDAAECEAAASDDGCVLSLSPPFLEKGVIRRLRVAAIVLPAGVSNPAVSEAIADLADDPLPLTT
ncbi:hypothetical protein Pla108_08800 [Botrimarina colliarenosi]|uniref:Uncharacterized protein n=1 Tax=Botrimarina colliarenosi TaxID=2528001 RepID=A0A5C6AKG9_9BACT|nr:hypothetical protein [Botrimarina colliarenosi]TWT99936.1 hypothetical protein Pla108_08800 [Botrimarina colliarenosi]